MELSPIQLANNEVLIPLDYFGNETELEIIVEGSFARVRSQKKSQKKPRVPGSAIGQIDLKDSFFEPLPDDILDLFES